MPISELRIGDMFQYKTNDSNDIYAIRVINKFNDTIFNTKGKEFIFLMLDYLTMTQQFWKHQEVLALIIHLLLQIIL